MRVLIWAAIAVVSLLDVGADLCVAAVAIVYGLAWAASLPFALAGRALIALSRRLTHGRVP